MGLIIIIVFPFIFLCLAATEIAECYFENKAAVQKLRIRADLLKAGVDPDRLDKENGEE